MAWKGFLCLKKIIYTGTKLKKASFSNTKIIRSNILFFKKNQYAMLCLNQSKTNNEHIGISMVFVATGEKTCSMAALFRFYILNPQPANILLFYLLSSAFLRFSMVTALKKRFLLANLA